MRSPSLEWRCHSQKWHLPCVWFKLAESIAFKQHQQDSSWVALEDRHLNVDFFCSYLCRSDPWLVDGWTACSPPPHTLPTPKCCRSAFKIGTWSLLSPQASGKATCTCFPLTTEWVYVALLCSVVVGRWPHTSPAWLGVPPCSCQREVNPRELFPLSVLSCESVPREAIMQAQ